MTAYTAHTVSITDTDSVTVYTRPSWFGVDAYGEMVRTLPDGSTETYGQTEATDFQGYCVTEVVGVLSIRVAGNFPRLSDGWNVWENMPNGLPECECDED